MDNQDHCKEELEQIIMKIERYEDKMNKAQELLRTFHASQSEITKLQVQIEAGHRRVTDKESSLEKLYLNETDYQLQALLVNFDAQADVKRADLMRLQRAVEFANRDISLERESLDDLNTKKGQAVSMKEQLRQYRTTQVELLTSLSRKYNIPLPIGYGDQIELRVVDQFIAALSSKVECLVMRFTS